ncbi:MAG: MoaD/ThiS family protein [Limisphaerales bacterium]
MTVPVRYWSWFKELAGTECEAFELPDGGNLGELLGLIRERHPRFEQVRNSTLVAVGVEYRDAAHTLKAGDEVSLFPPVQGG